MAHTPFPPPLEDLAPARFDTVPILRKLAVAHRHLAELKGVAASMPNQSILINTLALREAKDSSEIENIVTTHDELFRETAHTVAGAPAAKEVARYRQALRVGFDTVRATGMLTTNQIIAIQFELEKNRPGLRKLPGTVLADGAGKVVYTPPSPEHLPGLMGDLDRFINEPERFDADPLIKMALIHHQFESIHPFPDGNGRIGRILNVLYLTRTGLLDIPVLYLSRFITRNKADYYRHLQAVRDTGDWEPWVIYMLEAVAETSATTVEIVTGIRQQMADVKHRLREDLPKIYSQELLNNLFRHPYTRIEYLQNDLDVSRQTAAKYLDTLAEQGFVEKHRSGKHNYFINVALVKLFLDVSGGP